MRQFEKQRDGIDTVILGDSHAKWGLDPSVLGDAFNLALPGESYAETYYVLEHLVKSSPGAPRFVILQADLHSFNGYNRNQFAFAHHYADFVDYIDIGWRRGSKP